MILFVLTCSAYFAWSDGARPGSAGEETPARSLLHGHDQAADLKKLSNILTEHGWTPIHGQDLDEISTLSPYHSLMNSMNTICQTGFETGRNSLYILQNVPNAKLFAMGPGLQQWANPAAKYLQELFPGRINVTLAADDWQDGSWSTSVSAAMSKFRNAAPNITCDMIISGGGRSYENTKESLLSAAIDLASNDTTVLQIGCVLFDSPFGGVYEAWSELAASGCLLTKPSMYHYEGRFKGVCTGGFNLLPGSPCRDPQNIKPKRVMEIYFDPARVFDSNESKPNLENSMLTNILESSHCRRMVKSDIALALDSGMAKNDLAFGLLTETWDFRYFPFGDSSWKNGDAEPTYNGNDTAVAFSSLEACALEYLDDVDAMSFLFCVHSHFPQLISSEIKSEYNQNATLSVHDLALVSSKSLHSCLGSNLLLQAKINSCVDTPATVSEASAFYVFRAASVNDAFRAASVNASVAVNDTEAQNSMKVFVDGYWVDTSKITEELYHSADCDNCMCSFLNFVKVLVPELVKDDKETWIHLQQGLEHERECEHERERQLSKEKSKSSTEQLHWACFFVHLLIVFART